MESEQEIRENMRGVIAESINNFVSLRQSTSDVI